MPCPTGNLSRDWGQVDFALLTALPCPRLYPTIRTHVRDQQNPRHIFPGNHAPQGGRRRLPGQLPPGKGTAALITFIETRLFTRKVGDYLSVEEYRALQWELATRPDIGDIIPASGGVRKVRWAGKGRGKRGGLRIIYYWRTTHGQILLLTLYAKNETADITAEQLDLILREVNS